MQIILLETLNKLGNAGDTVSVKDGYARNYLIPNKKAIVANKKNKDDLASKMKQISENHQRKIDEANLIKSKLDGKKVTLQMEANEDGNLYGNISHKVILKEIKDSFSIDLIPDNLIFGPIKNIGAHEITIRLYDNINSKIEINLENKI